MTNEYEKAYISDGIWGNKMYLDTVSDSASLHSNGARQKAPENSRQVKGAGAGRVARVSGSPANPHAQGKGTKASGSARWTWRPAGMPRPERPAVAGWTGDANVGLPAGPLCLRGAGSGELARAGGEGFAAPGGGGRARQAGLAPACRALRSALGSPPLSPLGLPPDFGWS